MVLKWPNRDTDNQILEFLASHGIVSTPRVITIETGIEYQKVKHRLRDLTNAGLIAHPEPNELPGGITTRGLYVITELGERYLSGDATIGELEDAFDAE